MKTLREPAAGEPMVQVIRNLYANQRLIARRIWWLEGTLAAYGLFSGIAMLALAR